MGVFARSWKWMKEHYIWTIIIVIVLFLIGLLTAGIGTAIIIIGLLLTSRTIKTRKVVANANKIYLGLYENIYNAISNQYNSKNRESIVPLNSTLTNLLILYMKDGVIWSKNTKLALKQAFKLKRTEIIGVYDWVMKHNKSMFDTLDGIAYGGKLGVIDATPTMNFDKFRTDMGNMSDKKVKIMYNLAVAYFIAYVSAVIGYMNITVMRLKYSKENRIRVNQIKIEALKNYSKTVLSNISLIMSLLNMRIIKSENVENTASRFKSANKGSIKKFFSPMSAYVESCGKLGNLKLYASQLNKSETKIDKMDTIDKTLGSILTNRNVEEIKISKTPIVYPGMIKPFAEKNVLAPIGKVVKGSAVGKRKIVGSKAKMKKKCKGGQCITKK
jgi:hypothetical protein